MGSPVVVTMPILHQRANGLSCNRWNAALLLPSPPCSFALPKDDIYLLLQVKVEQVQAVVGGILTRLCANPLHGPRILLLLARLLPPGHVTAIQVPAGYDLQS